MIRFVLALVLAAPLYARADDAADACGASLRDLPALDFEDAVDAFTDEECAAIREPVTRELAARIAAGQWPADAGEQERDAVREMVDGAMLRLELGAKDMIAARARLDAMLAHDAKSPADAVEESGDGWSASRQLQRLEAILDGAASGFEPLPKDRPGWVIEHHWCGTPAYAYWLHATTSVSAADAWLALGRPDVAVRELLLEQWDLALSLGLAPPRLRELAENAFGKGSYEREVAAAFRRIEITELPGGRSARMPLLGTWVALPVGYRSIGVGSDEVESKDFSDAAEIEAYVRARLFPSEDEP